MPRNLWTEEEAKGKQCPLCSMLEQKRPVGCQGSKCMFWQWSEDKVLWPKEDKLLRAKVDWRGLISVQGSTTIKAEQTLPVGRCGLIGVLRP